MEERKERKGSDWLFYIVVLFCLLISMACLYVVKDAEQRCDERYKPLVKSCSHVSDEGLYDSMRQINLSTYPDYMKGLT